MRCITLHSNDPFFNLAAEDYLLRQSDEEYFILSINSPSVIIGKHQSPHREVNTEFVFKNNIPVIRRITGGGTVFHDLGNLNFAFIRNSKSGQQVDFIKHTGPVIEFLNKLGVKVKFEGKSDLKVTGLKVSGNAGHVYKNRVIHHGTLLFSASMEMLGNSIRKDGSCYKTRAVSSNPSEVSNLNVFLPGISDIFELRDLLAGFIVDREPEAVSDELNKTEVEDISRLAITKYESWEWNWAYGPEYQYIRKFDYMGSTIACRIDVKDGIIRECLLNGNIILEKAASKLKGVKHMPAEMGRVILNENITGLEIFNFF